MTKDPYLEAISDKIRSGEPVGFLDAIAAINYQEHLRRERIANSPWRRLCAWAKRLVLRSRA